MIGDDIQQNKKVWKVKCLDAERQRFGCETKITSDLRKK